MLCQSCDAVTINGMKVHERGCPDAWKDYERACKWCGSEFIPEHRLQQFCDDSCARAFNGFPDEESEDL